MTIWARSLSMLLGRRPDRMQVGALCRDAGSGQVLLVSSRDTGRWVIPKGWPMKGRSLSGAAAQEAWEEAGVRGPVTPSEVGRVRYDKHLSGGVSMPIDLRVFVLDVTDISDDFPERHQRKRRWCSPAEAIRLVVEPDLKQLIARLADHGLR